MKLNLKLSALAAALLFAAGSASANVITTDVNVTPTASVQYVNFSVTTAGQFDIWALGSDTLGAGYSLDPQIHLFKDTLSNYLYGDDDSGGTAGGFWDALIANVDLEIGNYILAVSQFELTDVEAMAGVNSDVVNSGLVRVSIDSFNGNAVPEPATLALMSLGLLGLVSTRRKLV